MKDQSKRTNLRLVGTPHRVPVQKSDFVEPGPQTGLFPRLKAGLLIFVFFPDVTEQEFREAIEFSQPSLVMELRRAPRFDIGHLNRREAFQVFANHHSMYVDLTSESMGKLFDGDDIVSSVTQFWQVKRPAFDRPIMFLLDRSESAPTVTSRILHALKDLTPDGAELCEVPTFTEREK